MWSKKTDQTDYNKFKNNYNLHDLTRTTGYPKMPCNLLDVPSCPRRECCERNKDNLGAFDFTVSQILDRLRRPRCLEVWSIDLWPGPRRTGSNLKVCLTSNIVAHMMRTSLLWRGTPSLKPKTLCIFWYISTYWKEPLRPESRTESWWVSYWQLCWIPNTH